jgi:predicted CXXCH cytochrome family protein
LKRKWGFFLTLIIGFSIILSGCMADEEIIENASYIGSDACISCHQNIAGHYAMTTHAKIFANLDEYPVNWDQNVTIWASAEGEEPQSAKLNLKNSLGVMLDHYVVSKIDGIPGFHRVAALEKTDNGYELQPLELKDGNEKDWVAKSYAHCVDCHSPGLSVEGLGAENLQSGLSCETCHGPGAVHAQTKKPETIIANQAACIKCHTLGEPAQAENGDFLVADTHYGVRNWFVSDHYTSGYLDCLSCHTPHSTNEQGRMLKQDSFEENCATCHGRKDFNQDEIMWKNPTDLRGHFTRDHSFGKLLYEDLGDDPETKEIEITDPEAIKTIENLSKGGE